MHRVEKCPVRGSTGLKAPKSAVLDQSVEVYSEFGPPDNNARLCDGA